MYLPSRLAIQNIFEISIQRSNSIGYLQGQHFLFADPTILIHFCSKSVLRFVSITQSEPKVNPLAS
jgi:hypothetical protein